MNLDNAFYTITSLWGVVMGLIVLVLSLVFTRNGFRHKFIYWIAALSGLGQVIAFGTAFLNVGGDNKMLPLIGRPAAFLLLFAFISLLVMMHEDYKAINKNIKE
jgi:hypothetical protein